MPKKLLLVDDEPGLVLLTSSRLKANGFWVVGAYDAATCLEKAKQEKPDLILLDVMMPKVDGYQTLAQLRNFPETKKIPVIMFSARAMEADKERAIAAGAVGYVVKPFEPKVLVETIQQALSLS